MENSSSGNFSININRHHVSFYLYEKVIMLTVLVVVAITGVLGNSFTCIIFAQNKPLRTSGNYFIVSLAVADLLQSFNMIFIFISIINDGWVLSEGLCQLCGWTNMSFIITSVFTLALIGAQRYFAVVRKTMIKLFSRRNSLYLIVFSWIYPAIFAIAPLFGWAKYEYRPGKLMCTLQFSESISYTLTLMIAGIFLPFAIMCYTSFKIIKEIRYSRIRISNTSTAAQQRGRCERRISIMLTSIVIFFFIFYSPASIVNLYQLGRGNDYTTPYRIDAWSVIMAMFNHANNPIIYSILNPNFRKGYRAICVKERRRQLSNAVALQQLQQKQVEAMES